MSGYLELFESGELRARRDEAFVRLEDCDLCARRCHKNRVEGEEGDCRTGVQARVSSHFPHFGEEDCLRGYAGSGTIFFSECNLRCVFCQNFEISHEGEGSAADGETLAAMMLGLQSRECHNINFVTPSHVVPQILDALLIAVRGGLRIPLVYNTGGYDSVETLRLLDGVIDIYMPDIKTLDREKARKYLNAPDYPEVAAGCVKEMHRQVGDLVVDAQGVARKGLLIRHLVMPGSVEDTADIMRFISSNISKKSAINIMGQYRPCGSAGDFPEISRRPSPEEMMSAYKSALSGGLSNLISP
ncbi:MAG: radical SAM protein [Deltaproteobacteria bacterium]|nr:radical SAM protein [Deltaproteobacteria bacterium]